MKKPMVNCGKVLSKFGIGSKQIYKDRKSKNWLDDNAQPDNTNLNAFDDDYHLGGGNEIDTGQ